MHQSFDYFDYDINDKVYYDLIYDDSEGNNIWNNGDEYGNVLQQEKINFSDITEVCVIPTLFDVCSTYFSILGLCLCFQCINNIFTLNETIKHSLSCVLGIVILYSYFHDLIIHCIVLAVIAYIFIRNILYHKFYNKIVTVSLLTYLAVCEFALEGISWSRIRNVQMLIVMKIISLISDSENKRIPKFPSFVAYLGYLFCVGNCVFGPWVNYVSYLEIYKYKIWNWSLLVDIIRAIVQSLAFFTMSMCYLDWVLYDADIKTVLPMYGKALEFRTSHYFVMFMSESFALATGFGFSLKNNECYTTKPSKIEFPRSLVEVVVYWNVPMHKWLKTYVFRPLYNYGTFFSVIGTYFISSLLHGLNYQLSGILLSLAIYTYIEQVFRQKLSQRFNACVLTKPCKSTCVEHANTSKKFIVYVVNFMFSLIALYHLSYLGYLIDLRTDHKLSFSQSFHQWRKQNYSSHWLAFLMYVVHFLI